jgi:hypothetical protein
LIFVRRQSPSSANVSSILILRNAVLAVCCLACIAWLASGCRRANVTVSDAAAAKDRLRIVSEADDGPPPQNRSGPPTDFLERHSQRMAGPNGIDCGRVLIGGDPTRATKCALRAQAKMTPFRVRYDLRGVDSSVAIAMVRTPAGSLVAMSYDSDPSGGGGRFHGFIFPVPCPEPTHLSVNSKGRVDCFEEKSSHSGNGPNDPMSE